MTVTNTGGDYTIPLLQPGFYNLRAEHPGFKAFQRGRIEVRIAQLVQVDAQLEIGSAAETLTINAETPLLDMVSASEGSTVDARRVEELPIQQGVPYHLIALSTGVVRTGTNMLDENPYDGTIVSYSVGGASASSNMITIDGAVTGSITQGLPSYSPPADTVGEFSMLTSNFDATQGYTQGANVSVSMKAGTNRPHGSLYWYGGGNGSFIALMSSRGFPNRPPAPISAGALLWAARWKYLKYITVRIERFSTSVTKGSTEHRY
jgi:hypothetical protein